MASILSSSYVLTTLFLQECVRLFSYFMQKQQNVHDRMTLAKNALFLYFCCFSCFYILQNLLWTSDGTTFFNRNFLKIPFRFYQSFLLHFGSKNRSATALFFSFWWEMRDVQTKSKTKAQLALTMGFDLKLEKSTQ